jgi:beta-glucosidase
LLSTSNYVPGTALTVSVAVTNTGTRPGSTVVQCYVAPVAPRLVRPPKELKAFAKVRLDPGASETVVLNLEDRAFACWDPGQPDWLTLEARFAVAAGMAPAARERRAPGWYVDPGRYEVLIGSSSAEITGRATVVVDATDTA